MFRFVRGCKSWDITPGVIDLKSEPVVISDYQFDLIGNVGTL